MPSLANPFQGSATATYGTKNSLIPEVGSDIYGKQSSLANPLSISGAATFGTKPGLGNAVYFSIGPVGDYKTIDDITGNLSVSINSGIASFSFPQLNSNIGIGDKISWSGGYCYIKRKLNQYMWMVTNEYGVPYSNLSLRNVTSITKVFNSLITAIDGNSPGLNSLLGSYNLKSLDVQPNLVCYAMDETGSIEIKDLWTIDGSRYIKIFTPFNLIEECNTRQKHHDIWGSGYKLQSNTGDVISILQNRIIIQGLQLSTTSGNGILVNSAYNIIRDNIIKDCSNNGIYDNNDDNKHSSNYYISNTIYNCTNVGIEFGKEENTASLKYGYIYNNTIIECGTGIKIRTINGGITYITYLKNNLCQDNTKDYDLEMPPDISSQPVSLTVTEGDYASFSITATGASPFSYQWKKNGSDIFGATSSLYEIISTISTDDGYYTCLVSNAYGSILSDEVTLEVNVPPTISVQPSDLTVNAGDYASFSITASGAPSPTYQWKKDTINIIGATSDTYEIDAAVESDEGSYTCLVSNVAGSILSDPGVLTVNTWAMSPSLGLYGFLLHRLIK